MRKTKLEKARDNADKIFDIDCTLSHLDFVIGQYGKKRGVPQLILSNIGLNLTEEIRRSMTKTMVAKSKIEKKRLEAELLKLVK